MQKRSKDELTWEREFSSLEKSINSLLKNIPASERDDVIQEARINSWLALQRYDGRVKFKTFVYPALQHSMGHWMRDKYSSIRTPAYIEEDKSKHHLKPTIISIFDEEGNLKDIPSIDKEYLWLYQGLNKLSRRDRQDIYLYFFRGLEEREIAKLLGISKKEFKDRLENSLSKLRTLVEDI